MRVRRRTTSWRSTRHNRCQLMWRYATQIARRLVSDDNLSRNLVVVASAVNAQGLYGDVWMLTVVALDALPPAITDALS